LLFPPKFKVYGASSRASQPLITARASCLLLWLALALKQLALLLAED